MYLGGTGIASFFDQDRQPRDRDYAPCLRVKPKFQLVVEALLSNTLRINGSSAQKLVEPLPE